jgi:tetratricopeptide (TPR) repeat protein
MWLNTGIRFPRTKQNARRWPFLMMLAFSLCISSALAAAQNSSATSSPPENASAPNTPSTFEDVAAAALDAREHNDVSRALQLYGQAVSMNPKWPDGWWFLGSMQYGTGSYALARDSLTQYIALTPNAGPAFAMRGLCEFEIAEYAGALSDIQHGLALGAANQPRNEKILRYHEALLLTRASRFEEALRSFNFFAREESPNPELYVAVGLGGLRIPALPKELASDKIELVSATGRAGIDFMKGDQSAAHEEFARLFDQFPATVNLHYFYGYLLYPIDVSGGSAEFKRELEVSPANPTAESVLAWVLVLQSRAAEALPYAQKAAAQDPGLPSVQLVLGRALLETGDVKAGLVHLEKALALQPENLEVHLALAKAYSETGRKDDARRERLLCLEMTKSDAKEALHP